MPSADVHDASAPAPVKTTTEEEWTFVRPKKSRNGRQRKPRLPEGHEISLANTNLKENRTAVPPSPQDIAIDYNRVRSQYEQDGASDALKRMVKSIQPDCVDRAICLGVGTFDPPDGGWDTKRRTFFQLSAFLDMVDILEDGRDTGSIPCFFQEPLFTESDKAFLEALRPNVKVVESPCGFEMVDSKTFLYGVHLYRPIYAEALEKATPSVFVGTSLDIWDTVSFGQATEFLSLANVKTIETTYQKREFPPGDTTAFSSTSIYWRIEQKEELKGTSSSESEGITDLSDNLRAVDINPPEDQHPIDERTVLEGT